MKKLAVLTLVLLMIFNLAGCGGKEEVPAGENAAQGEKQVQNEETKPDAHEDQEPVTEETETAGQREELLAEAFAGKMTGIEIALGDSGEQVMAALGEPEAWDYFAGGTFLSYDDVIFFCTIDWDDEENPHGDVVRIVYLGRNEVYGLNLGMNPDDVRALLGEPDEVYQDPNAEDEFYLDSLVWSYTAGDHQVDVIFDSADGLLSAIHLVETRQ